MHLCHPHGPLAHWLMPRLGLCSQLLYCTVIAHHKPGVVAQSTAACSVNHRLRLSKGGLCMLWMRAWVCLGLTGAIHCHTSSGRGDTACNCGSMQSAGVSPSPAPARFALAWCMRVKVGCSVMPACCWQQCVQSTAALWQLLTRVTSQGQAHYELSNRSSWYKFST